MLYIVLSVLYIYTFFFITVYVRPTRIRCVYWRQKHAAYTHIHTHTSSFYIISESWRHKTTINKSNSFTEIECSINTIHKPAAASKRKHFVESIYQNVCLCFPCTRNIMTTKEVGWVKVPHKRTNCRLDFKRLPSKPEFWQGRSVHSARRSVTSNCLSNVKMMPEMQILH